MGVVDDLVSKLRGTADTVKGAIRDTREANAKFQRDRIDAAVDGPAPKPQKPASSSSYADDPGFSSTSTRGKTSPPPEMLKKRGGIVKAPARPATKKVVKRGR